MMKTEKTKEYSSQMVDARCGFSSQAKRGIILLLTTIQAGIQQWSDELYNSTVNHIDFSPKRASQTNILTSKKLFADFQIYRELIILTWDGSSDATSQGELNRSA